MSRTIVYGASVKQEAPHLGWTAKVAASWTLAGGVAGGVLVSGLILAGRLHPDAALTITGMMATLGSILGMIHGAVLGHIGRPPDAAAPVRWPEVALASVATAGAYACALLVAQWLAVAAVLVRAGTIQGWTAIFIAGSLAFGILGWATYLGWHTLETAYTRWPDHRIGSRLVIGTFALLVLMFLQAHPGIPGTGLRFSAIASLVFAGLATFWIAAPAIVIALRIMHRGR